MAAPAIEREEARPGEGGAPHLSLGTFDGPLDLLLSLARARAIDLARVSLPDLLDQLSGALIAPSMALGEKAGWLVMAAWLVLLRSRLLLPDDAAVQQDAAAEARQLRDRLLDLQAAQSLAAWLDRRPQLGHDVFARGQPEFLGTELTTDHAVDVVEFLWACLPLFDDGIAEADTTSVYTPPWHGLPDARSALARILELLEATADPVPLGALLPPPPQAGSDAPSRISLRRRAAWSTTFVAGLELARQGTLKLQQDATFAEIRVQALWASVLDAADSPQT